MASPPIVPEVALTLALAVVASSTAPLLLLDDDCIVVAASASFSLAFGIPAGSLVGHSIYGLGGGEWDVPRLRSLLTATISGAADVPAYEIDLRLPGRGKRRLVLNAHKLAYLGGEDGAGSVRMLLAIADVTDARASEALKDDLLREKAVLMQEIQHRVANSLQIIASLLLQNARRIGSEESRAHLRDAHGRVMAIAELQRQLAESAIIDVDIGAYLAQLCQSLAASMIEDQQRITLVASADGSRVTANASVSIGLVVTELVINALKHAFPEQRRGAIRVDYAAGDGGWTLQVSDNGVGMATGDAAKPGLGTSIVNALARHLQADVLVSDARPGTIVALHHGLVVDDTDVLDEVAV